MVACGGDGAPADDESRSSDDDRARIQAGGGEGGGYAGESIYAEAGKLIRTDESLVALGNELFGDRVSLYNGALEFVQTDVSIPGNSSLPVAVGRRHTAPVTVGEIPRQVPNGIFGDWDLEIPHLHGVFGGSWTVDWPGAEAQKRCTRYGPPPPVSATQGVIGTFNHNEYWHGNSIYVPGAGSQEILSRVAGQAPTDGLSYPLTTKDRWMIRCLPTMARGSGEGFLAISPDGTQYKFDWMVSRSYSTLVKGSAAPTQRGGRNATAEAGKPAAPTPNLFAGYMMQRSEVWIMPTEVKDRHGNTVTYTYDSSNPWRLSSIQGTDASGSPRLINLGYGANGLVSTVTTVNAGVSRTWTYGYRAIPTGYVLSNLTLPDGSAWTFNLDGLTYGGQLTWGGGGCGAENELNTTPRIGTMTHPSGASGSFTVMATHHGRSHVDYYCVNTSGGDPDTGNELYPRFTDRFSITSKTIGGPGMAAKTWAYAYGPHNASFAPCSGCADTKTVTVTDPEGAQTRYTFGIRFRQTEGQLLQTDEAWNGSTALKTTTRQYALPTNGPWPDPIGYSIQTRGNGELASRSAPERLRVVTQQGATFTWQVNQAPSGQFSFDQFAKPLDVTRFSSLGHTRREITVFNDNFAKWVLGLPASVTDYTTGAVVEQNTYDTSTANRTAKYAFGRLLETYSYYSQANGDPSPGMLKTRTDALGRTTVLSSYKRGLARSAAYADGSGESATINDDGTVASVTNAAGTTTSYGYDAMGRLSSIGYPGGDAVAYNTTTFTYAQVGTAEYGVGPDHWRLTKSTGNALSTTYFDGHWRPVMTRTWDSANPGGTRRVTVMRYDSAGRKTFESYPQRDIGAVGDSLAGRSTTYDALGRPIQQVASSELGDLTTTTAYLNGFQRRVTNPRGFATTQAFQAFDEPKEEGITALSAPEGVSVAINRDHFGKALSITRSGGGASAVRSYVYDGYQRLCKTIEPESGATLVAYQGSSDLAAWRASGLNLPSNSCDYASVPAASKISYGYDLRNRLTSTTYGDGSQAITRSYTPDGLLQQIVASDPYNPITWNYYYNNRRLLTREQYAWWPGAIGAWEGWNFTYYNNENGHVGTFGDPWGNIDYTPNALGEPTQVSGYASGVTYHPTGAVAGYTLANGVTHSTTLNVRGLPLRMSNAGVTQDAYTYDANGNIASITDEQEGVNSRTMPPVGGYDGLDRLRQVNGPWGTAGFTYDALDNLISSALSGTGSVPARNLSHTIDAATNRLTGLTGSQNITVGYDANGNVTQRGAQNFVFDIGNRMRIAVGKASYVYDGHGRRNLAWFAGGDYMHQVYTKDGKLRFAWRLSEGGLRHVYLGDKLIAEGAGNGTTYFHADVLGSPIARTNGSGGLVSRTRYEPYGATVAGSMNPTKIGFTGHVNDADTGLVYMQQRYYDPTAGRFLSVDPVVTNWDSGSSFNRYVYAQNNPYRYTDPDGRSARAMQLVGTAAYRVASELGAAALGSWIGITLYDVLHQEGSDSAQDPLGSSGGAEHTSGARPSKEQDHEKGKARKKRDRGGEDGDERRDYPRRKPDGWKGPWPPVKKPDPPKPTPAPEPEKPAEEKPPPPPPPPPPPAPT